MSGFCNILLFSLQDVGLVREALARAHLLIDNLSQFVNIS